jgi:membrane-associated protein
MEELYAYALEAIHFVLKIDVYLHAIIAQYGAWSYAVLFLIVFAETGFVVTPFLPGDSLLFAAGALAAGESLHLGWLMLTLFTAAVIGDAVNYHIGKYLGPKVLKENSKIFKKEYMDKTQSFYDKYGSKTIVIARFVPIVRTFAPFLAGVGHMEYSKFVTYNIAGAALWIFVCCLGGYFFGNLPIVKNNFGLVVIGIIVVSVLPIAIEFIKAKRARA